MNNKLSFVNNWEAHEYYIGDRKVSVLTKVRINGDTHKVIAKYRCVPYSDMGHTYSGCSMHFLVMDSFGLLVELKDIMKDHEVFAEEFKLSKK